MSGRGTNDGEGSYGHDMSGIISAVGAKQRRPAKDEHQGEFIELKNFSTQS